MDQDGISGLKRIRQEAFDLPTSVGYGERRYDLRALTFANSVPIADAQPGAVPGLYTLFAAGELVYIGHSKNIGQRLTAHRRNVRQWLDHVRIAWMPFADINEARLVERMVVDRRLWYRPAWNGTRFGLGKEAEQIVQAWFEEKLAEQC